MHNPFFHRPAGGGRHCRTSKSSLHPPPPPSPSHTPPPSSPLPSPPPQACRWWATLLSPATWREETSSLRGETLHCWALACAPTLRPASRWGAMPVPVRPAEGQGAVNRCLAAAGHWPALQLRGLQAGGGRGRHMHLSCRLQGKPAAQGSALTCRRPLVRPYTPALPQLWTQTCWARLLRLICNL